MELDRRSLLQAAGLALAAPALLRLGMVEALAQGAPAAASGAAEQAPGFYRFRLGSRTVTLLNDGFGSRPNPTQGFVRNAGAAEVEAALREAFLPTEQMPIPYTATVLETPQGLVLFDTGTGGQLGRTAGNIPANMRAAGFSPDDIAMVVLTHFHGDHITGLTDAEGKPSFAKAEIVVPKPEWDFWMVEGQMSRAPQGMKGAFENVRKRFAPYKGRIRQIESTAEVAPGIQAQPTFGHTPGHTSYLLSDGNAQVMLLGDVTNRPELNLRHPGWHLVFDMDGEVAETTRRKVFDQVAAERMRCIGYHFPFPANGYVTKEAEGYRFVPANWSSEI